MDEARNEILEDFGLGKQTLVHGFYDGIGKNEEMKEIELASRRKSALGKLFFQ